jgi:hypothetical protein
MDQIVCTVNGDPCAAAVLLLSYSCWPPTCQRGMIRRGIPVPIGINHAAMWSFNQLCRSTNGGSGSFIGGEYGLL